MLPTARTNPRSLTYVLTVLLVVPLFEATHHHEADHDGALSHIETDHGGHFEASVELDDRVVSMGPAPLAAPVSGWSLPGGIWTYATLQSSREVVHPARPPPAAVKARAPPPSI